MSDFAVLVVCVGNVCRSPLGERLLAARLPEGVTVSSAGVQALAGSPMVPEAAELCASYGGSAEGFLARQLTPVLVQQADLILTATRDIRSRVLTEVPGAVRRTFTVLELAALAQQVQRAGPLSALVRDCAAARSRAGIEDYDIPDPYRRGDEAHARAAAMMDAAIDQIAKALS